MPGHKYRLISKFPKLAVGQNIRVFASFNQDTGSLQPNQCIPASLLNKAHCKADF